MVDLLSLTCLHPASMLQCERTDLSLSSNLATQIKGLKNKPKKKSSFSVFDDESKHPRMCCSLNIAFNHAISICGIHSDNIFHNENIYFVSVLIVAHLTHYVSIYRKQCI